VVKQLGREVNQSPSSSAEVKEWSYTSSLPLFLHGRGQKQLSLHLYTEAVLRQYTFFTGITLNNDYNSYVALDTRAYVRGE
jgi:hypothetical protein